ncbi:flagellar basal body P-ring formation chaperone FlgA [Limimaricola sp. G21655-S1]|uniref:flagellar basal body P-ring formation chaperone FlgA n=1 Tax=Limimaricola sp. G21655-S1 TaxID=3014768 RepID=UPI0027B9714A|nr:flagellar basal body P-ring formation chaperone FlgA [Limimaricola sp. G21655-S1]
MIRPIALLALLAGPAAAEMVVVPARTLPPRTMIGPEDLLLRDLDALGAVIDPARIIGLETRVALYAGRPVRPGDVGPPATVGRNAIVPLIYEAAGLRIVTEGRALDRAGPGDLIRVMNLASRATVTARIGPDGMAHVSR